ncbi:MAG: tetratricopeptide repeat protein [Proteobacteria bacterium]|nr:tetratricopeptide repeat protein [Pseudomonadota bacterium]
MEENLSERQQIEQVRDWLKENAPWAIAGIVLGVGGLIGVQQWRGWQENQSLTAAAKYTATLTALGGNSPEDATKLVAELREHYSRTPYPDMAALAVAHFDVDTGKLAEAATLLGEVAKSGRDAELQAVARLRLARVQRALGKPDEALATLGAATPADLPAYADARGDLLADKGDQAGALSAWHAALAGAGLDPAARELIELKITAAGGELPAPVAAATGVKP